MTWHNEYTTTPIDWFDIETERALDEEYWDDSFDDDDIDFLDY